MWEIPQETPRMVLLCSEETNWFTVLNAKRQEKYGRREGVGEIKLLVVTITVHDDLNSDYVFHKASLSLRDSRDTMFFAGPCTGGSSWARLNRGRGPQTEAIIDAKVLIFKQLWGRFEILFVTFYDRCIGIYMELPRGCQYWNNDEVRFMIEGTESTIHDFDGCCYGLRQRYGESNMYIKKPWRIVSWNVELGNKLSSKCDGRHEHAPCAGRETLHTQIYTSKIVSIILEEQHRRSVCVHRDSVNMHTDGSSGHKNKRCAVAASCIKTYGIEERNQHVHSCQLTKVWRRTCITFTLSKKSTKKGLRWNTALSSEKHQDLNSGSPPTGAIGAARAGSTGGRKTCSIAMAASGSHTRPQAGGNDPQLFVLDEITNGIRYLKATGEIMKVLIEEEARALVGDPTNQEVDQEITLILNHYGFDQIYGKNGDLLRNLKDGRSKLSRQIVENENYRRSLPQLKFETKVGQPEQEKPGSHPRPESQAKADYEQPSKPPTVFGPGGKSYEPANDDPMGRPEVDLKPRSGRSEDVGATAKAHATKARPPIPEPKAMPNQPKAMPRQPPDPPPSPRNQPGKGSRTTDSETTNDPSQSSQAPINPNQGEKGSGKKGGRKGSKGGYQQPHYQNRGKGGLGKTSSNWMGLLRMVMETTS